MWGDPSTNMTPDSLSYNQYIMTIKSQVNFAKTIHDMLIEGSKRITQSDLGMSSMSAVAPSTAPTQNTSVVLVIGLICKIIKTIK